MLGESVLSILTTKGSHSWQYATSFFCGLLTITMFQYLFFRSQPSEAKDHAMRRSQGGGFVWVYMHTVYSASLVLVGCAYKMMLSPDEMEEENEELGIEPNYDLNERIAFIYAVSQTVSFLSLDAMLLAHRGFKQNFLRFFPPTGRVSVAPWVVFGCSLLLLCGTLFGLKRIRDMTHLSIVGCLLVFGQVVLRTMGMKYFPISVEAMERAIQQDYDSVQGSDDDHQRWPNVTRPGN